MLRPASAALFALALGCSRASSPDAAAGAPSLALAPASPSPAPSSSPSPAPPRDACPTWDGVAIWGERDHDGRFLLHVRGVPEPAEIHCNTCGSMVRVGDETRGLGGWSDVFPLDHEPEDGACVLIDLEGRMRPPETPIGRYSRHRRGD